jgi:hypothetical protein
MMGLFASILAGAAEFTPYQVPVGLHKAAQIRMQGQISDDNWTLC